jgi:hypothetical protein
MRSGIRFQACGLCRSMAPARRQHGSSQKSLVRGCRRPGLNFGLRCQDHRHCLRLLLVRSGDDQPSADVVWIEDSPVGLAAWMLDQDARSQALTARVFQGQPEGLTRDDIKTPHPKLGRPPVRNRVLVIVVSRCSGPVTGIPDALDASVRRP